jgi:hypothetical protein
MFIFFVLGTKYSRKNKSKSNKNASVSSSNSIDDHVMNLENDYKKTPNIEVTDHGCIMERRPYLIESI